MQKYYTRACNFYYGKQSIEKIKKKLALPLVITSSFLLIYRNNYKKIKKKLPERYKLSKQKLKKKIKLDLKLITKQKYFKNLNFSNFPILMGILNLTPDSFSDGGKYNKKK